jgi:peptide/nickel transport system permease protein
MKLEDAAYRLKEFWGEFRKERNGLVGLGILIVAVLAVLLEPLILPYPEASARWRDITYWQDNSKSAPPAWTNLFTSRKSAVARTLWDSRIDDKGPSEKAYTFSYDYDFHKAPYDFLVRGEGSGTIPLTVTVKRPDGISVEVVRYVLQDLAGQTFRLSFTNEGKANALEFLKRTERPENAAQIATMSYGVPEILFSKAEPDFVKGPKPLTGTYEIEVTAGFTDPRASIEHIEIVVVGRVSGILGTDSMKRDIFSGVVAGMKWALMIGLLTSIVSVLVGVFYGITAAYFGGRVDSVMMLIFDYFISLPVLPILIVFSAVYKPSIWTIIAALILFFWVGPVKTVRSMALQIKEETYIEAAKALGAGHGRIIFRHMAPLLIPYSFASMALAVPGAIVYESSVSLLGLGDATIVSWGQILHDALGSGAVLSGLWWWVVPPGLLIAVMGMTFAFLGFAMDKILHPKLKTR